MPIEFAPHRWDKVREDARRWWSGELKRPLIQMRLGGADPGRSEPELPGVRRTAHYDFSVPVSRIVDRWDYELSCARYEGDAFPARFVDFGPGVIAAFLGAPTGLGEDTVWFHSPDERPIADIRFDYNGENAWFRRVTSLGAAALDRWEGNVQIGMTDLGGNLDILSTFRPGERLLLDLYDHPEEVQRLTWEAHGMWWRYFDEINRRLQPANPGYTAWTPIYSETPYYMLQCDFCYMISPDMFDEFVKPELAATCRRLVNPFYHLDGPGQLPHLDSLLQIEELKGVQWIPGAGQPGFEYWPQVYRRVRDAGKLIQFSGNIQTFETLVGHLGSAEGIVFMGSASIYDQAEVTAFLRKYGVI